jgi:hypothetical protein
VINFSRWRPAHWHPYVLATLVGAVALLSQLEALPNVGEVFGDKDAFVRWSNALSGATRDATPVTLIDIDNETLAAFGGPDRAPRDFVADLITLAAAKRPLGIFVDLDTSKPSGQSAADAKLATTVSHYPPGASPLLFARRMIDAKKGEPATDLGLVPLPSILDEAMAGHANVRSVVSVTRRDADHVVRRWQLTQTLCDGARSTTLASPQLVSAALSRAPATGIADADRFLDWQTEKVCAKNHAPHPEWPRNAESAATIAFVAGAADLAGAGPAAFGKTGTAPAILRISARTLIGENGAIVSPRTVADHIFAQRFVIIGASHHDSFDTHITPLGALPGSAIVANAVATAPATLASIHVSPVAVATIAFVLFAVVAAVTMKLRALVAGPIVGIFLLVAVAVLGRIFVPATAIEIVTTAVAMIAVFSVLESVHAIIHGWRSGKGWRALLKPPSANPH